MTFFSKLLNTLGFDSPGSEYEDDTTEAVTEALPAAPIIESTEEDNAMVHSIFDKVMEIVNASLPDFLAKSVDPNRQKQYMFDALDESVKQYIRSLDSAARERCEVLWQEERAKLQEEMSKLKDQTKQLEDKRSRLKEQQLSADRQKRALSERVHDLEAQVLKLEAEREQFELENKSLLNKAKVAAVYEKELEELRSASSHRSSGVSAPLQTSTQEIERLKAEIETLKAENKRLNDAHDAVSTKDKMEEAMVEELRKIAAESKSKAAELQTALDAVQKDYDLAQARLEDACAKVKTLESKLSESEVSQAQLEEINAQVERFSEIKEKLDNRIAVLKDNLQRANTENESLRETIKNNLFQHAAQEKELEQEIETLRSQISNYERTPKPAKTKRPKNNDADTDTSDVDDVITNNDFLTSDPDPGRFPPHPEAEFGYTAPPRKPKPDPSSQPSLFDE